MVPVMIVAIDGPVGAGKSTVARGVAKTYPGFFDDLARLR